MTSLYKTICSAKIAWGLSGCSGYTILRTVGTRPYNIKVASFKSSFIVPRGDVRLDPRLQCLRAAAEVGSTPGSNLPGDLLEHLVRVGVPTEEAVNDQRMRTIPLCDHNRCSAGI